MDNTIKFMTKVRSTGKCTHCHRKENEGTIGYVISRHISSYGDWTRFDVKWEDGHIENQCSDCCEAIGQCNWEPGTEVGPIKSVCPVCGGEADLSWVGTVIERITDNKGIRYRVRIPDSSRAKGRLIWLGCPLCLGKIESRIYTGTTSTTSSLVSAEYRPRKKGKRRTYNMNY